VLRFERRIIRQISANFDTSSLGYDSALVAGKYKPERIEEGARIVSSYPSVSHNYQRNHDFNLWYTLAVPPDSCLGLTETIRTIHELSGAETTHPLPSLRLFKIAVKFDLVGARSTTEGGRLSTYDESDRAIASRYRISDRDRAVIRVLQQDLPVVTDPFADWAHQAGCTVDYLLSAAKRLLKPKQMRRFAAVLRHRSAGIRGNVMGVWQAPRREAEKCETMLAGFPEVIHCYLRWSYPDWPYNLFMMVHGKTRFEAIATIKRMARATEIKDRHALWSVQEFKKVRIRHLPTTSGGGNPTRLGQHSRWPYWNARGAKGLRPQFHDRIRSSYSSPSTSSRLPSESRQLRTVGGPALNEVRQSPRR
jgi:DNA-binding Lrp family transcriptional regulator